MSLATDLRPVADSLSAGQLVTVRGDTGLRPTCSAARYLSRRRAASVGEGLPVVSLMSVADGGLGDELRVHWELASGWRVLDRAALPDLSKARFGDPAQQGAFLDAL